MNFDTTLLARNLANHLWQSTAFALAALLLVFAFRSTHARARYWLLGAASLKFLVPFALLLAVGSFIGDNLLPQPPVAPIPAAAKSIAVPFTPPATTVERSVTFTPEAPAPLPLSTILLLLWAVGATAVAVRWWSQWLQVRAVVHAAAPLVDGPVADALRRLDAPDIPLASSDARLEPGVFGVFRPVLWVPAGIADHLSPAEMEAILAHELCHVRRRDNLAALIHKLVEVLFWFHPLVWWLGRRLVDERERACDEQVVSLTGQPHAYAEGILKVCEFCITVPPYCAAGISGSDLRRRIESIVSGRFVAELCLWKRAALTGLLALAVAGPFLLGVLRVHAQNNKSEFEVASIRSVDRPTAPPRQVVSGTRAEYTNITLSRLIAAAWERSPRFVTCPDDFRQIYFNISAKMPAGSTPQDAPKMLQTLLVERFKLRTHLEDKPMKVLALVVAKGGSKLKEGTGDEPGQPPPPPAAPYRVNILAWTNYEPGTRTEETLDPAAGTLSVKARNMSMKTLASWLTVSHFTSDDYVVDATQLPSRYDFQFQVRGALSTPSGSGNADAADSASAPENRLNNMRRALREIGLDLDYRKAAISYVVVDSAEKKPTEN